MFSSIFSLIQKFLSISLWSYKWAFFMLEESKRLLSRKTYLDIQICEYIQQLCTYFLSMEYGLNSIFLFSCQRLESMTFHFRTKSLTVAGGWRPCWVSRSQISWPFSKDFWLQRIYLYYACWLYKMTFEDLVTKVVGT